MIFPSSFSHAGDSLLGHERWVGIEASEYIE